MVGAGAILWQILIGLVYVIAALYMLVLPVAGVVALTLVLAFYIAVEGVFELIVLSLPSAAARSGLVPSGWFGFVTAFWPHLLSLAVEFTVGCGHVGRD